MPNVPSAAADTNAEDEDETVLMIKELLDTRIRSGHSLVHDFMYMVPLSQTWGSEL